MRRPGLTPTTIGFLLVILTSAALALYVWLFASSMLRDLTIKHLILLLFLWQTQVGAMFAVAAALIGAAFILHQTQETRRLEDERRKRRADALRAALPLGLMELADYAIKCVTVLNEVSKRRPILPIGAVESPIRGNIPFPSVPDGLISQLTELIEATEADHGRPFVILIRRLQIQHARARSIQRQAADTAGCLIILNVADGAIGAAEIYARCDILLPYARGETITPIAEISPDDFRRAFRQMQIYNERFNQRLEYRVKIGEDLAQT